MSGKKGSSSKFAITPPLVSIHPSPPVPKAQDVESILFHGLGKMITISGDDSTPSAQTLSAAHVDLLNQEELDFLLECFITFTNMKPLASHMNELFPMLERIPMDVTANP